MLHNFNKIFLLVFCMRRICNPLLMPVMRDNQVFLPALPDVRFTLFCFEFSLYFCIVKKIKKWSE